MIQDSIESFAFQTLERIVNDVTYEEQNLIDKSEQFLLEKKSIANNEAVLKSLFVQEEDGYIVKNIKWPKISEFSEKLAIEKLNEYMKTTWEYDECWLYCIDFIQKIDKEFTTLYNFRARWSIPTRRKPIPRFTASVYFTFDVSKIKPKDTEVTVYYVFETQKLIHKPGVSRFRQEWLSDIIDLKEALIKDCKF